MGRVTKTLTSNVRVFVTRANKKLLVRSSSLLFFQVGRWSWGHKLKRFTKPAVQKHDKGRPAVFPGIQLFRDTRLVANRDFENLIASLKNAGGDLGLDLETATLHRQGTGQYTRYQLIAGLHIVNTRAKQYIRDHGQEAIAPASRKLLPREVAIAIYSHLTITC